MTQTPTKPLPVTFAECKKRGWDEVDIVLVTGDGYIDHPSFGVALIGRLLESRGYRVAILPQPRFDNENDFKRFGKPRLFFGISAGNLDSIVANYSGNGKVRDFDAFSPKGNPWRTSHQARENRWRPDRAILTYTELARRAYPGVYVVLGGVEASLRRFVHFDYKQNKLRGSHLADSKADLLIYGMGEKSVLQTAQALSAGQQLNNVPGTCIRMNDRDMISFQEHMEQTDSAVFELPSWQSIQENSEFFMTAEMEIDRHARGMSKTILIQKQQVMWVVQFPACRPLDPGEMDRLYELPFSRKPHPSSPDIPAHAMIKDSISIVRGCSGNCSFCSISRHQGPAVTSRGIDSIVDEVHSIVGSGKFKGTISDLGGPTANLYGTSCAIGSCKKYDCLYPRVCKNLRIDENRFIDLLDRVLEIEEVKHVYISSGLRMELLRKTPKLMRKLIDKHIPGSLKIAPEHTEKEVLQLMHKEPHSQLVAFLDTFKSISRELGRKRQVTPYIISAHPGCTEKHTAQMVQKLKELGVTIRQFQDFTPTPGTISTAMYVSQIHRETGKPIEVAETQRERKAQRSLIEKAFFQKKSPGKRVAETPPGARSKKNRRH